MTNLLVEIAPGWWPLYANKTARPGRAGEARARKSGDAEGAQAHAAHAAEVAAKLHVRSSGARQLSRLLAPAGDAGGWGFSAALTSSGKAFTSAERFEEFLVRMGGNGYWDQIDVWLARDADVLRRSRRLVCLRQQDPTRAQKACTPAARGRGRGAARGRGRGSAAPSAREVMRQAP